MFFTRWTHDTRIGDWQSSGSHAHTSFGLQMLVEVDVRLADRLSVFAGLRTELRYLRTLEGSSGYPTAGVRVAF